MTILIEKRESETTVRRADRDGGNPGAILAVIEWLTGDEYNALDEAGLISGVGRRLRGLGVPVDRLTAS